MALLIRKPVLRKRPEKIPSIRQVKPLPHEPVAHVEPWLMRRFPRPEPVPRFPRDEIKPIVRRTTTIDMKKIRKTLPQPTPKPKTPEIGDKVNLIDLVGNVQDVKSEPSTKPTISISKITTTAKPTIPTQKATTATEPGFEQLESAIKGNQTTENATRTKITDFLKKWGALILIIVLIGLFLGGRRK